MKPGTGKILREGDVLVENPCPISAINVLWIEHNDSRSAPPREFLLITAS